MSTANYLIAPALVASLLAFMNSASAETLTLPQVLEKVDLSPRVERSRSQSEESSWKRVESYSGFLPTLTLSGNYLMDKKYVVTDINLGGNPVSVPQILPTTSYNLGANWLLFDGFANIDRWSSAKENEAAGKSEYSWTQFQQQREIIILFYRALAAQSLKEVAEQNLKTLEDHLNDARLLKKTGISTNYDVLQVEVRVSEAKSEVMNATDNVSISALRLGESIGEDYSHADVTGKMPTFEASVVQNVKEDDFSGRDDISALKHRVGALEQQVDAAGKHWVPRVSLYGNYQKYNNLNDRFDDNDALRDAYGVGLQLSWNIFDGLASTSKKNQVIEQRYQTEKTLKIAQVKAATDAEMWKRKFQYFISVYQARQSDVVKATESVRLAREGRRAGVRTNTDLLDAELELFRASAGVVNAQIGAIESLVNLELSTGQKLYQF